MTTKPTKLPAILPGLTARVKTRLSMIGKVDMEIAHERQYKLVGGAVANLKKLHKSIEERRHKLVDSKSAWVRGVNAAFLEIKQPIESMQKVFEKAMADFYLKQKREAEEKAQKQLEAEGKNEVAVVPKQIETPAGGLKVIERWTFEIEDITKVPAYFLEVDSLKVMAQVHAGNRSIPGLKIYQAPHFSPST